MNMKNTFVQYVFKDIFSFVVAFFILSLSFGLQNQFFYSVFSGFVFVVTIM